MCAFQWVSSALKHARIPSVYHNVSERACQLIAILYNISPTFIGADSAHTIELALAVIVVLFTNCAHLELV